MQDQLFLQNLQYAMTYLLIFSITTFVNKYVLTVLQFTYPTIFQGLQTFFGAVILYILHRNKYISLTTEHFKRNNLRLWVPGMVLYVCSIYSGSVALANLTVPVFLCLHNLLHIFSVTIGIAVYHKGVLVSRYISLVFLIISALMVISTDPEFSPMGYKWAALHVLSTGFYRFYAEIFVDKLEMSGIDIVFCNYAFSAFWLTPASYIFGDVLAVKDYKFLDLYTFYVGCILSGLLGAFLSLSKVRLKEQPREILTLDLVNSLAKIITAVVSLLLFDITLEATNLFWIIINLTVSVLSVEMPLAAEHTRLDSTSSENGKFANVA